MPLLWAGKVDEDVCSRIQELDRGIETRTFQELAHELTTADEKKISTTVYHSTAAKYQKTYKDIKDKQKTADAMMEVVHRVSVKGVAGEWSRARINSKNDLRRVWSHMLPQIMGDTEDMPLEPQREEENVSVTRVRRERQQVEHLL